MPRPRMQRLVLRKRGLGAVELGRGFDVGIYDEISEKISSVSGMAHDLPTGPAFRVIVLRYVRPVDLQPAGGVS